MDTTHGRYSHGHAGVNGKSRTYVTWRDMKRRCLNPKQKDFAAYGAKGITVCTRWLKFENFLEDMGCAPDGYELDRVNNKRGYSKSNCRWVSSTTQARNRSYCKLSMEKARAIRADTRTNLATAKAYGVSEYAVWCVRANKTWKENTK